VRQKQLQDDKDAQKAADCGHPPTIHRLQEQLKGTGVKIKLHVMFVERESETAKARDRMDNLVKHREREIANTTEKIQQSKKELDQLRKRAQMTESERIVDLEQKIIGTELKIKDLIKEIKQLTRMQHDQGNELVELTNTGEYPDKIRGLMEEVRWHRDRQLELKERTQNEDKQVKRQKEHLLNLEDSKKDLEIKYKRQLMKLVSSHCLIIIHGI
jgi:chemotaxis regulatin CheY-phosphate phosphatase CheZ